MRSGTEVWFDPPSSWTVWVATVVHLLEGSALRMVTVALSGPAGFDFGLSGQRREVTGDLQLMDVKIRNARCVP